MSDAKPVCAANSPAPPVERRNLFGQRYTAWNARYEHPDAELLKVDELFGRIVACPHCGQTTTR